MRRSVFPIRMPSLLADTLFRRIRTFHSQYQVLNGSPHRTFTSTCLATSVSSRPLETIREWLRCNAALGPTIVAVALKSCRGKSGGQIHGLAVSSGLVSFLPVSNSLMNMYSKSGAFDLACKFFVEIPNPDVVSWNTILSGFDYGIDAVEFVVDMHRAGVHLDAVTFTTALAFSADLQDMDFGQQLHSLVFKSGFGDDLFVRNALITAYSRSACLEEASRLFDEMIFRDLVSWNALLCGLTQEGDCGFEAIRLFLRMVTEEGLRPDHISFASVISACGHVGNLDFGCQVHSFTTKVGLETHLTVSNVLMSMYYKNGAVDCAKKVFGNMKERNVISWTTMISLDSNNAVSLFNAMRLDEVQPNDVTFVALVYAVSTEHLKREGQMIHGACFKTGILAEVNVSNSLITMYGKLESTEDSRKIFKDMNLKELVSWNALISAYAQNELCDEALAIFSSLIIHFRPNHYTFGSILGAITAVQTVSLTFGQRSHSFIIKLGLNTGEYVSGAIIDMYAKRGSIEESQRAFNETVQKNLISWTAIISAHARHGNYAVVMSLFKDMVNSGVHPDHVTFLEVLMACSCKGMVEMGRKFFDSMVVEHKIEPWPEHYVCMVDMLGRVGRLVEAEEFVRQIPTGPGLSALQSLLGACRVHGNVEMGKRVAEALMKMEPMESGAYVLISNIYADRGEWGKVAEIRRGMREKGVKKEVGFSWVDVGIRDSIHMHKFSSDDKTHPLAEEIYRVAQDLGLEMQISNDDVYIETFACIGH